MIVLWLLLLIGILGVSSAYAETTEQTVQSITQDAQKIFNPNQANLVPGFTPNLPPEAALADPKALESARIKGSSEAGSKEAESYIVKTAGTRPYYHLDPSKDPTLKRSRDIMQNAEGVISGAYTPTRTETTYETKFCVESKALPPVVCQKTLQNTKIEITPAKYSNYWCAAGRHRPDDPQCQAKTYYSPARKYQDEVVKVTQEEWINQCSSLEEKEKRGECRVLNKICPMGRQTKEIVAQVKDGIPETRPITRDCWQWVYEYDCTPCGNPHETCSPLRDAGCDQMDSKCKDTKDGKCIQFEQTYRCSKATKIVPQEGVKPSQHALVPDTWDPKKMPMTPMPEQVSGTENDASTQSQDMQESLSKLMLLKEAQSEMRTHTDAKTLPRVFKGQEGQCTIAFANFKNCCKDNGWGVDLGLVGCDGEDKDLAQKREKNLCIEVGTYCAQELPILGCIRKKRKFCCYAHKLARVLHEQGRPQIGRSLGDPKGPDCNGFTVEELSLLDFNRLNLTEIHQDVIDRMRLPNADVLKERLGKRVGEMTSDVKQRFERQGQGAF